MYGTHLFEFEELEVYKDKDGDPVFVDVYVGLVCSDPGEPESGRNGPPEFYDPGCGPTWDIDNIQIIFPELVKPLDVTEEQLTALFENGADIINNALEDAARDGILG